MKNIIKDIERNCEDQSIEGIVLFLTKRGDFHRTSEQHREIYFFYKSARKMPMTHRLARQTTIELFGIKPHTFKRIINKYK